jgi:uncharacterized protein YkwD
MAVLWLVLVAAAIHLMLAALAESGGAQAVTDFTSLEKDIAREVSLARNNPSRYASFIEQWKTFYSGRRIERPGKLTILTEEGAAAVEEAVIFLRSVSPRPALRLSHGMSRGAKDHARQLGAAGTVGHRGLYGSWPTERVNRYGNWRDAMGENIFYGSGTAREIVMLLIIDDGIPGRDHRRTTFDAAYGVIGVGCAPHISYDTICVLTFAGRYTEGKM